MTRVLATSGACPEIQIYPIGNKIFPFFDIELTDGSDRDLDCDNLGLTDIYMYNIYILLKFCYDQEFPG